MNDVLDLLGHWHLDNRQVLERMYRAPTPREREGWHALGLLGRGLSAVQVAEALGLDPHTVGNWLENFHRAGPWGLAFEQTGVPPP